MNSFSYLSRIYFKEGCGHYKVQWLVFRRLEIREHVPRRHCVYTFLAVLCFALEHNK